MNKLSNPATILYLCKLDKMLADDTKEALFAWDGYAKATAAAEK